MIANCFLFVCLFALRITYIVNWPTPDLQGQNSSSSLHDIRSMQLAVQVFEKTWTDSDLDRQPLSTPFSRCNYNDGVQSTCMRTFGLKHGEFWKKWDVAYIFLSFLSFSLPHIFRIPGILESCVCMCECVCLCVCVGGGDCFIFRPDESV